MMKLSQCSLRVYQHDSRHDALGDSTYEIFKYFLEQPTKLNGQICNQQKDLEIKDQSLKEYP